MDEPSMHGPRRSTRLPPALRRAYANGVAPLVMGGLAVAAASVVVPSIGGVHFGSPILGIYAALTVPSFVVGTLLGGLALLAAAVVARLRQPRNAIWRLLAAVYFANFLWVLYFIPTSATWTLAEVTLLVDAAVFAHVALAFPFGHLRSRREALLVRAVYVYAIGISLALLAVWEPTFPCDAFCPSNVLLVWPSEGAAVVLSGTRLLGVPAIGMVVAVLVWRHWRTSTAPTRRALLPVMAAFPVILLWAVVTIPAHLLHADAVVSVMTSPVPAAIVDFVLPAAFLAGALRLRMAGLSVASAVLELGAVPTPARLQDVLRRRLRDPSLTVLRWSPTRSAFLGEGGHAVTPSTLGTGEALTVLERHGAPVAAIRHDAALLDDTALTERIRSAAAVALDASEMRDQLRARGGDTVGLPKGEVTFLFADVERSTTLLEVLGERYADVLTELRQSATRVADSNGGRVVDARGDELFLAFPEPGGATRAAVELQKELDVIPWPSEVDVRLRIGLHLGRPELTPAGYVGLDVHKAARIMAAAHGGQILASEHVVAQLDPDQSISRRPLGRFTLRGIAEPVTLFAVESPTGRNQLASPRSDVANRDR